MESSKIDHFSALRDPPWQLAIVFLVVLLSRLPFLDAGYGLNVDAWRVALTAREIAVTGDYSVSRFPGYPIQEIVCSWFWRGGPFALNALSAIFSAIAATAFAAIARELDGRDSLLAALAFAATPILFISSVSSKDYVWAITFVLLAILSALHQRSVLAGMFLGLATGCRITSLSALLPIALILFSPRDGISVVIDRRDSERIASVSKFVGTSIITAAIAFSPVWLRYGTAFWRFYEHARPDWVTVLSRGTVELWGTIGLFGLVLAFAGSLGRLLFVLSKHRRSQTAATAAQSAEDNGLYSANAIIIALVSWLVITIAMYLRLPDQAGYLLPAVPAVLLLAQQRAPRRAFQFACACLILSPFVDIGPKGVQAGAIFADRAERVHTLDQVEHFVRYAETLPGQNTIVVGAWEPIIATVAPHIAHGRNHYVYLLDDTALAAVLARNEPIFYAPRMREFNQRIYGIDLTKYGGINLRDSYLRPRR
jgi:hypothetical protein